MKWVLGIVGALIGIIGMVALIGLFVPEKHIATRAAKFDQAPGEVWSVLTDFTDYPSWNSAFTEVKKLPDHDGHTAWNLVGAQGNIPLAVIEADTNKKLVTRIIDEGMPFGGTWTYEITETDGGTMLQITEDGFIRNVIFRFMARFIFGYHSTMEGFLKDLGQKFNEEVMVVEPT